VRRCRCYQRQRAKARPRLAHTLGDAGEGGIRGEGQGRGEEASGLRMGGVCVCTCRDRGAVDVKVYIQWSGLGEDVADLRFELGVNGSAAEALLVMLTYAQHDQSIRQHTSASSGRHRNWSCCQHTSAVVTSSATGNADVF
jgi:hypothetical protein